MMCTVGKGWAAVVAVMLGGCASGPQARVAVGPSQVLGIADAALGSRVDQLAAAQRESFASCIDTLAQRTESTHLQEVVMTFSVREAAATVTEVHPANHQTVVDANLAACLETAISEWRLGNSEAQVRLSIKVNPQLPSEAARVNLATRQQGGFRPSE